MASGINNGNEAVVSTDITPQVTAVFDADGSLHGFDGCNEYAPSFADGDAISVSDAIITTRMACASDELSEQSAQYFTALVAATAWSVEANGSLELRDDQGRSRSSYTAAVG